MRAHGAFYRKGPILPNGPEIAVGMPLDILSIVASPLGRSDAYVELMELDAINSESTKRPRNRSGDAT